MKKEGEISKTIIFFASTLSFIFGIVLMSFISVLSVVDEFYYFGLFLFALILFTLFKADRKIRIAILMAIFLFLGMWRYSISILKVAVGDLAYFNGTDVKIKGVVSSDIVKKSGKQKFTIKATKIERSNWQDVKANVLVYAMAYPQFNYGDELIFSCELKTPEAFEGFAYDRYLARHHVYSICYYPRIKKTGEDKGNYFLTISFNLKNKIRDIIDRGLSEPESGLARAIILGDGNIIDNDLRADFSRSGISHIVAISGLHIGIIAGMIAFFLFKIGLSRDKIFYFTTIILALFIILVGMPASAVRAGIMVILAMYALKIGRVSQIERLIILVACILLLINPKLLRDDIGFQLSFTAVLGISYIFPIIKKYLEKIKVTNKFKIRDILGVTLAAQISTGPIAAFHFGVLPILGIMANLLVLWTLPFLIASIILAIFLSFIFSKFIVFIFFIPMATIDYIILVSGLVSKIPLAFFEVNLNIVFLLVYYVLLGSYCFWGNRKLNKNITCQNDKRDT